METPEVVLRFLESAGRRNEAEFYLSLFRAEAKERFATITVDMNVAKHALDAVVLDLRFLASLGLTPVVALGLFEPNVAAEHAQRIATRLAADGVPVDVFPARDRSGPDVAAIVAATHRGAIPLVPFGTGSGGNVDERIARLGALLTALQTRKLIFLSRRGALRQQGAVVEVVNLSTDYDLLLASPDLGAKQRMLLAQSRRLVYELVPHRLLVSVTSPLDLLRELFTIKGAGTLLRRGATIVKRRGFAEVDLERLKDLLASSFARPAAEPFFAREVSSLYLEESYQGVAILQDAPVGAYLTKFAVTREAQGEGLGRDLWERLFAEHPVVFWRARAANPIGAWYVKLCDGLVRTPQWHVFWKGLNVDRIPEAVAYALGQPVDVAPPQGS